MPEHTRALRSELQCDLLLLHFIEEALEDEAKDDQYNNPDTYPESNIWDWEAKQLFQDAQIIIHATHFPKTKREIQSLFYLFRAAVSVVFPKWLP